MDLMLILASVEKLKEFKISAVACGLQHSLALNEWGQPFSWGCNSMGQLGLDPKNDSQSHNVPAIVRMLATKNVVQIACGSYHSIALTNSKYFQLLNNILFVFCMYQN